MASRSLQSLSLARASSRSFVVVHVPKKCPWTASCRRHYQSRAYFSSIPTDPPKDGDNDVVPKQPFVQASIRPGEWDPKRTNPLYRPAWKSRAKILSAEDFAKRPKAGTSIEFESLSDAMVTLSWFDQNECDRIFQLYVELITHSSEQHQRTSHEYVMRLIAQKYHITAERVAGIIQLKHNEQQMRKEGKTLAYDVAEYMDDAIKKEIADAYQTFNLKQPTAFVEDPVGVEGVKESKQWSEVSDIFDTEEILQETVLREEREARILIDGHVYVEDEDDFEQKVPLDKDCQQLLKRHKALASSENKQSTGSGAVPEWPTRKDGKQQRPRWKFVAQTINTRELKRQKARSRSYSNNSPANTLVEHDGTLRAANMADVKGVSWKPVRNVQEFTYQGAKRGWLDKIHRDNHDAWGTAPIEETTQQAAAADKESTAEATETMEEEEEGRHGSDSDELSAASDDSSSSSSESGEDEAEAVDNVDDDDENTPKDDADENENGDGDDGDNEKK